MSAFLQRERHGAVLMVRMNSPETRNALTTPEQFQELVDLCAELRQDHSVKAVVLTGNGKAFCSGGNIKDMQNREGIFAGSPYELHNNYRHGIQKIPLALYELDVPIIAAVNGAAIGAGLDLACMCDIRIASNTALFAESFVKLGIIPGDGGLGFYRVLSVFLRPVLWRLLATRLMRKKLWSGGWLSSCARRTNSRHKRLRWRNGSPRIQAML